MITLLLICLLLAGCGQAEQEAEPVDTHHAAAEEGKESKEEAPNQEQAGASEASGDNVNEGTAAQDTEAANATEESPSVPEPTDGEPAEDEVYQNAAEIGEDLLLEEESAALLDTPAAVPKVLKAEASGVLVEQNERAVIDYSNTTDGYVMVKFSAQTEKRLKAQVVGPGTTYSYNLSRGKWEVFPLSDGNGTYKVTVYENASENKYAAVLSVTMDVAMKDEFTVFLHPNQYVDYGVAAATVAKAAELTGNMTDPLQEVKAVYDFTVTNLTYDSAKAATIKSGYLPVLDTVLAEKKGICFDYAALMTGMLRSQGIPCKLVVGYAGEAYHAWISVWTEETGWLDGVIFFDGVSWKRMDPTFASSGNQSASIMAYIGDGKNYTEKYFY